MVYQNFRDPIFLKMVGEWCIMGTDYHIWKCWLKKLSYILEEWEVPEYGEAIMVAYHLKMVWCI